MNAAAKPETAIPVARDFAHAVELAGQGQRVRLYVANDKAERDAFSKLRRLGEKHGLVELVVAAPRPGTCESCGAAILWARTPAGKKMPLDREPQKRVILGKTTGLAHVLDAYMPHWASCPHADQHRRPR